MERQGNAESAAGAISFAAMSMRARCDGHENRRARWILGLVFIVFVALPRGVEARPGEVAPPTVIMISLDGTRPIDVDRATLPSLVELAEGGVRARGLVPATPSNTFPSHVTLVTGVSPDRHGLVNNFFIDPERGPFKKRDIPTWIEVEPLWSWLEARGVATASYHWVGSEGEWPGGRAPTHWRRFSASTRPLKKVETILGWLDEVEASRRPRFITSWFPGADHVAHRDGPGSPTARIALAKQDEAFAALRDGLRARGAWATTTLIVVSDHGMAAAERLLDFDAVLEGVGIRARVSGLGGFANVYLARGLDAVERGEASSKIAELARQSGVEAIRVGAEGGAFSHRRFGDLVLRAPLGTAFCRPGLPAGGFHGYDSELEPMHGLFIASGRGVAAGSRIGVVRSVDVAPTVLALLGFEAPTWMAGEPIGLLSPSSTPTFPQAEATSE